MRYRTLVIIGLLMFLAIYMIPASEARVDVVTFHRFAGDGPLASTFNEGETIYVNISDGRTRGGSRQYEVVDGNGTSHNLVCWDNGNNVDKVPRDGWYTGAFTPYATRTPSTFHSKIKFDGDGNFTVIADLDRRGTTIITFELWVRPFEVFVWSVMESSPHVYFDNSTKILYYSNDQEFNATVVVRLKDNKPGADDKTVTGEAAFGDFPTDTDYITDRHWDMWYNMTINEVCDGTLIFSATDNQHYTAFTNLTVVLDNEGPIVSNVTIEDLPDHVGAVYDWWRPSEITGGLNVSWDHTDEAGPMSSTLDWDASVDANDQIGIDPGLDGWEIVTGLNDDGSCIVNATITVLDKVSNPGSGYVWAGFDQTAPGFVSIVVNETSDHIFFNGTLLYSNDQLMSDSFEFIVFDDEDGCGRKNASGSLAFGDQPSDLDYTDGWNLPYILHIGELSPSITIWLEDNVGNVEVGVVQTLLDNTNPTDLGTRVSESSPWLHLGGTLYFGDDMPSPQNLTFTGSASDNQGLWKVEFSQEGNLASSPATPYLISGGSDGWIGDYGFDPSSTDGDQTIDVTVFDLVGNTFMVAQTYLQDSSSPSISPWNYADGRIVSDIDEMLHYSDPWSVHTAVSVKDDLSGLYRVNVSLDDVPSSDWSNPWEGVYNETSTSLNWTGWHTITWTAVDVVNNTRTLDTSILRAPNTTDDRFRRQVAPGSTTLVDASTNTNFGATIEFDPSQEVWASVMEYPLNPITGRPAGNFTGETNRNYTTLHYLDVGVNRTSYYGSATIRVYFTNIELIYSYQNKEAVIGLARWDGADWHWFPASIVSRVNVTVGHRYYSGYAQITIDGLHNRSNIFAIAAWRFRVNIRDPLCDTNVTIFRTSLTNLYERIYTLTFRNNGGAADDYYVNATGPSDWLISWVPGGSIRKTIHSAEKLHNESLDLYVTIPPWASNVSAGSSGPGREYSIRVTIESMTDRISTENPWRSDLIDLTAYIRRTDLEVSQIVFDRITYLEEQHISVYVAVHNHGNYTDEPSTITLTMSVGGVPTALGTYDIPAAILEPETTAWLQFNTTAPKEFEEIVFKATLSYDGDEYDDEPNELEVSLQVQDPARGMASGGLPTVTALVLSTLAMVLGVTRKREDEDGTIPE